MEYLSVKQFARKYGISERTIRHYTGKLSARLFPRLIDAGQKLFMGKSSRVLLLLNKFAQEFGYTQHQFLILSNNTHIAKYLGIHLYGSHNSIFVICHKLIINPEQTNKIQIK